MNSNDHSQFYSAGYFIVRNNQPKWVEEVPDLLPPNLVSLSSCICSRLEIVWGWTPSDNEAAVKFGIPEGKWNEFQDWCSKGYEDWMDMWSMFHSTYTARQFIQQFLPDTSNLWIIGAGLPYEQEEKSWRGHEPEDPVDCYGIRKRVSRHIPLEPGGESLGFEVLSFEYGDIGHSWLCNYLHHDMNRLFGIKPNPYGLIDNYYDAKKVTDWIAEDEMKGIRAEPASYDFWLLMSYPLDEAKSQ